MLLSWIIFLPLIGAIVCLLVPSALSSAAKTISVVTSGLTFLVSLSLFGPFLSGDFGAAYGDGIQFGYSTPWIAVADFEINYSVGVDGLSFPLIILTTLITFLSCLASWNIDKSVKAYHALFLFLETGMLGTFMALDFFLFYVFWEIMLLPMYFLIGVWGGPRKTYAAIKFFLYTLFGSILMLVVLLGFWYYSAGVGEATFDLIKLATNGTIQAEFANATFIGETLKFSSVMFLFLFIGFAVKIPVFPFHTWLPDAHVEAPTPVSMILAGVLLKMGAYGLLRISYPILPTAGPLFAYGLALLGVINIIYGALCAMAQTDFKSLVAYSSISHMGYVLLGIAIMTDAGFQGAMFQVMAHGISSPMCFFLVGVIYDRAHHRQINRFGGLWNTMPTYTGIAILGFFASLGLPGLCGFIGEIWVLLGTFSAGSVHESMTPWVREMAIVAAFGVILTAGYILWMIQRVYKGDEKEEYKGFPDVSAREVAILTPMGVLAVLLGVYPMALFNLMNGTLDNIAKIFSP
jgi:NADH-quinone oxidoreductase subunit M